LGGRQKGQNRAKRIGKEKVQKKNGLQMKTCYRKEAPTIFRGNAGGSSISQSRELWTYFKEETGEDVGVKERGKVCVTLDRD